MQISKVKDFVERVVWTFGETYISLGALDWLSAGINMSLVNQLYVSLGAASAATIKVLLAQRVGARGAGDAIPGGVES